MPRVSLEGQSRRTFAVPMIVLCLEPRTRTALLNYSQTPVLRPRVALFHHLPHEHSNSEVMVGRFLGPRGAFGLRPLGALPVCRKLRMLLDV